MHSDHSIGYPDLIFTPWVMGRSAPSTSMVQLGTFFGTWTLGGDHLLSVSNPNTTIQFITDSQMSFPNSCRLVITRVSDGPVRFPVP